MQDNSTTPVLSRKRIAYVGSFPVGSASSYRTLGIALSLKEAEYEVLFCTRQLSRFDSADKNIEPSKFPVAYINFSEKPLSRFSKTVNYLISGYRTVKWLNKLTPRPTAVLMYGADSLYAASLLSWCKHNNVPLIADAVEWYQPSHLQFGRWGPFRWNVEMAMQYYFVRAGNIIPISRYLERYYHAKGCCTLRIPPTHDVSAITARTKVSSSSPLTLAYTGFPAKKDLLNNVLESIMRLDMSGKTIKLIVAGPHPDEIVQLPAIKTRGITALPKCVKALGRVSHEQAVDTVRQVDFSVLLRPQLRYAQAGFPTKVTESLAVGTPVICNLTSDLGDYILDGTNGLICQDHTPEAFTEALGRALAMTPEQRQAMRQKARLQAERSFDYSNYVESLKTFLLEVCG